MTYDATKIPGEVLRLHAQAQLSEELERLEWVGFDGGEVLDVGCGPGQFGAYIQKEYSWYQARVLGIDKNAFPGSPIPTVQGDLYSLPFADNTFENAYTRLVLRHVKAPTEALEEIVRVVVPGGGIFAIDSVDSSLKIHPEPSDWLRTMAMRYAWFRQRGTNPNVGAALPGMMANIGLEDIKVTVLKVSTDTLGVDGFYDIAIKPFLDAANDHAVHNNGPSAPDFRDAWIENQGEGSIQLWIAGGKKPSP